MLYPAYQAARIAFDGIAAGSELVAGAALPWWSAPAALLHRITKPYPKPAFAIPGVVEEVVEVRPFVRLLHLAPQHGPRGPQVLVVAPLSGHHATLVRDTVTTLLADHDVYITDWTCAREVPLAAGAFSLDRYIAEVRHFIHALGAASLHVVAVCQPTVPVLAALALDAADGAAAPRSLVLMGGPIDARKNPTVVNKLATDHPLAWFEQFMIHEVPAAYPGAGRRVYPGFLQLTSFVLMNPANHARAYVDYWLAKLRGDDAAARTHEQFYDEYNAVLDMDAAFYLDTVRTVFQEHALARGTWRVGGQLVEPAAITRTALFTIEGELDDICGLGQTEAAHALCANLPAAAHRHLVAEGCGHYGLFSGRRWRTAIYPEVRDFIRHHEAP
jgi:poly(3-hydroxybutyrate) depolymerase